MTLEEAIKELKDASDREVRYGDINNHYYEIMMRIEAFDMAIKRLEELLEIHDNCKKCIEFSNFEQQPCEDCISREQAIKSTYGFERYTGIDEAPYEYAESILRDLPSVTPKSDSEWSSIGSNTDLETVPTNLQDWLSTFNTESATECFTAVQRLKERVNE